MSTITSITNPSSATSTTSTITAPSDLQAGDFLLLFDCASTSLSPPTVVTPTGWTALDSQSGTSMTDAMSYKIADGTEAGSSITGMNGGYSNRKLLVVFRGNVPFIAATIQSKVKQITASNPTSKTITSGSATTSILVIASWSDQIDSNDISPRTQSPTMTEVNNTTHQYIGWIPYYSSGWTDQTFDMDDEGADNALMGCYIELTGDAGQFFSVFD